MKASSLPERRKRGRGRVGWGRVVGGREEREVCFFLRVKEFAN